jgi:hypothetical protein
VTEAGQSTTVTSDFLRRWQASGAAERANYALFLAQLCDLIGVPQPDQTTDDAEKNAYVFEGLFDFTRRRTRFN